MRCAFCIFKYYPYGGLERDFIRILQVCQAQGHVIEVYTTCWQGSMPKNTKIIPIPVHGFTNHGRMACFVKKLANKLKPGAYDVVVGFNRMPNLDVFYAADMSFASKVKRYHGWLYKLTRRYKIYYKLEQAVFKSESNTQIMYLAEQVKQSYIKHYQTPKEYFHLLGPGISRDCMAPANYTEERKRLRKKYGLNNEHRLILQIGSNFKLKGLDRSLSAFSALPDEIRVKTILWIIGKGKRRKYMRQARKLGVAENIKFLGLSNKVSELLLAGDLLLHPARDEAAGMVIVEAIVAGLPVLTTSTCGFALHVEKAKAGMVVPEPFLQQKLDESLYEMLTSMSKTAWHNNGIAYGRQTDLYSRDKAVDIIEAAGI